MDKEIENAFINGLNESKNFDEIVEAITDCIYKKIERKLQSIKIYNEWYQLGVKKQLWCLRNNIIRRRKLYFKQYFKIKNT